MNPRDKIIRDIFKSIKECLNWVKIRDPNLYRLLTFSYDKGAERKLSDIIYELYHLDPKVAYYFNDIYGLEIKRGYEQKVKEMDAKFKDNLKQAMRVLQVHRYKDRFRVDDGDPFWIVVYMGLVGIHERRMYLNCNPEFIHKVIIELVKVVVTTNIKIHFKFPNYKMVDNNLFIRSDKMVVYYKNDIRVHQTLQNWARSISSFLHEDAPLFTIKEINGVAFVYEPTPDQQAYAKKHTRKEASFGELVSLIIARYLYSWCDDHKKIPDDGEILKISHEIFEEKLKKEHKFF